MLIFPTTIKVIDHASDSHEFSDLVCVPVNILGKLTKSLKCYKILRFVAVDFKRWECTLIIIYIILNGYCSRGYKYFKTEDFSRHASHYLSLKCGNVQMCKYLPWFNIHILL